MSTVEVSLKVLLATDASDFADSFGAALEQAGCRVETAATTQDALAAASNAYELVFLDLDAADVDGMTVLQDLQDRKGLAAPPVVLLKGEGEPAHVIQRGLDLGASGYVLKHRIPSDLSTEAVMALFRSVAPGPDHGEAPTAPARPDACPYSAATRFDNCSVFLPVSTSTLNGGATRISCSHLRVGTLDTWRLYPRCGLGDENTRAKYFRDQTA
jgi:DNA-binding response OmpR family regulator